MREAFTLHLKPDENMVADTQVTKAIIYIEETNSMADVTFPSLPHVVSLLHYDDVAKTPGNLHPPAGYPVICVTVSLTGKERYPDYDKTGSICVSEHINNTLTRYRWLISAPAGPDGVTSPTREVDFDTFFTSSKMITLDSVYFQAGSRVQCAARAVTSNGDEGLELSSPIVTISQEEGMCQPRKMGTVGAEPFSAKLRYTGADDQKHPNLIKVTVTMPHIDGSPDGTRVGNHRCSNLLDYNEVTTGHSFITSLTRNTESMGDTAPYQFSSLLRGNSTLRFYRNLNLEACLWEFTSYYHMSELLTDCGGTIGTDGQVLNLVQSYVTLRVPLYVSYVFHSPVGTGGWQHFDLQSELRLTFVYDTAILWKDGIGSPPQAELQDDPSAMSLVRQPGSDGFRLDSTAMFQVAAGREWFIHTIYTVRSKENANRGIGKRSLEYHSFVSTSSELSLTQSGSKGHRPRRSAGDEIPEIAEDIGAENNRGTNIMHISLDRTKRRAGGANDLFAEELEPSELTTNENEEGVVTVVGAMVGLLFTVLIVVTLVLVLRSRQKDGKEGWREGVQEVVKGSVSTEPMLVVRMQDCHNSSEV
ncbi:unnamed protein product [Lampetra planeri]